MHHHELSLGASMTLQWSHCYVKNIWLLNIKGQDRQSYSHTESATQYDTLHEA